MKPAAPRLKRAEAYVVDQLKLNRSGTGGASGYYQAMEFESRQIDEKNSSLSLINKGQKKRSLWVRMPSSARALILRPAFKPAWFLLAME